MGKDTNKLNRILTERNTSGKGFLKDNLDNNIDALGLLSDNSYVSRG